MKRIVIHWSAGTHRASSLDLAHYHVCIEGDGTVVLGNLKPEANESTSDGQYAAHTRAFNTGAIGVALCAMHGAEGWPTMKPGPWAITQQQWASLPIVLADLCETYRIEPIRENVLTHAEVEEVHGVTQRGKWDIRWRPGATTVLSAKDVGDEIRASVRAVLTPDAAIDRELIAARIGQHAADLANIANQIRKES